MRYSVAITLALVSLFVIVIAGCGGDEKADDATNFVPEANSELAGRVGTAGGDSGGGGDNEGSDMDEMGGGDVPTDEEEGEMEGGDDMDEMGGGDAPMDEDEGGDEMDEMGGGDAPMDEEEGGMEEGGMEEDEGMEGGMDEGMDGMEGMEGGGGGSSRGRDSLADGFEGMSQSAFQEGRDRDAVRYLHALALTNDEAGGKTLATMKWVPALKRPALAVRWGVGVSIEGPTSTGGKSKSKSKRPDVWVFPGLVADEAFSLSYLKGRMARSFYGEVLSNAASSDGAPRAASRRRGGGSGMEEGGMEEGGMEEGGMEEGGMEEGGMEEGGMEEGGMEEGGGRRSRQRSAAGGAAARNLPGVTLLGKGKWEELLESAAGQQIDVLLVLNVKTKLTGMSSKNRKLSRSVSVGLYDVHAKTKIASTKAQSIPGSQVAEDDPIYKRQVTAIRDGLSKVFNAADEHFKMGELPAGLEPQHVLARVSTLTAEQQVDPLAMLTEIKFYHSRGLLPDNELTMAFQKVLGEDLGEQLISGDEEVKKKVVETLLSSAPSEPESKVPGRRKTLPELPPLR